MADEATIRQSLHILKDNLDYSSGPTGFQADINTAKGPTPGAITVAVAGTDVSLSQLTRPGLCWIQNLDATNYVTVGRWDPTGTGGGRFYPMMKLLPGECYLIRLADDVLDEYEGTGTGTGSTATTLRIKAANAPCIVRVDAFET